MIRFFVPGIPRPGGSKKVFLIQGGPRKGKPIVTDAAGKPNKDWKASVAHEASLVCDTPFEAKLPLLIGVDFYLQRPKGHFKPSGLLRSNAPERPTMKPDVDKLMRPILDAIKGIILSDDSQVVVMMAKKW